VFVSHAAVRQITLYQYQKTYDFADFVSLRSL